MKKIFSIFFFISFCSMAIAQNDSLVFDGTEHDYNYKLYKNIKSKEFYIQDENKKTVISKLKYCYPMQSAFQVIDKDTKMYYLSFDKLVIIPKDKIENFSFGCGNVSYYTLKIEETPLRYEIMEYTDNGLANGDSVIHVVKIASISKKIADSVFFSNRKQCYTFNGNFGNGSSKKFNPRQIICVKKHTYSLYGSKEKYSDIQCKITSNNDGGLTLIQNKKLYHYLEINKIPKYAKLEEFENSLSRFTLPNGIRGYVDYDGNEYW